METFADVPLNEIFCDEDFNSRGHISPASVHELSLDIEANGLFQPIVLQPYTKKGLKWRIVMGHRRFLATKAVCARKPEIAKTIKAKLVETLPEETALILNLKENMEREPLNMLQEARAIARFRDWGWDAKRTAVALGQTKKWVDVRPNLLSLPEVIQKRAEAGWLNNYQIEEIAALATDDERFARVRQIVEHEMRGQKPLKTKKRKGSVGRSLSSTGEPRTIEHIYNTLDHIQDVFENNAHPAAMALSWAAGVISTDELWQHAAKWAHDEGHLFERPKSA